MSWVYLAKMKAKILNVNNRKMNYQEFNEKINAEMEAALKSENFSKAEALQFQIGYLKQALFFEQNS